MAGRASPAAHPQIEFTTTITVPFVLRTTASTSSDVRVSSTPKRVRSSRIGFISISGYGMRRSLAHAGNMEFIQTSLFYETCSGRQHTSSRFLNTQKYATKAARGFIGPLHAIAQAVPTLIHSHVVIPSGQFEIAPDHRALTLEDVPEIFPSSANSCGGKPNPIETAYQISDMLRRECLLQGSHQHLFLLLYFDRVIEKLSSGWTLRCILLPLPKARFSLAGGDQTSSTTDFAFWTGRRFTTVFIRESRFDQDISAEERLLKMWGLDVFQLMADQLETRGLSNEAGERLLDTLWLGK